MNINYEYKEKLNYKPEYINHFEGEVCPSGELIVEFYFNKSYASSYQISKPSDNKSIETNELTTTSTIEKVDE